MAARGRGNSKNCKGQLNTLSNTLVEPDLSSHIGWEGECAPRDTSEPGSVAYPLNAEGGLNKFHASYKQARNVMGIDNIMHRNIENYIIHPKSATKILNWEATYNKIILMAIADSDNNSFVNNIIEILENAVTITGETSTSKIIEALLLREDRCNELGTGNTLQKLTNEFFNTNSELPLLKFGNGEEDINRGNFNEAVEIHNHQESYKIFDETLKYIMNKLSEDKDNFVHNEAFENKIDDLVFQYIREVFNIKSRISKENIITNIMLKYNVRTVNK